MDDISKIQGKVISLKQRNNTVKTIKINGEQIIINNLPVGTYLLQIPIVNGYSQDYLYVQVKENNDDELITTLSENKIPNMLPQTGIDFVTIIKTFTIIGLYFIIIIKK